MQGVLAGIIATMLISLLPMSGMAATPTPQASPRSIAVSVPPDPISLNPGETSQISILVINPRKTPVTVRVAGMGIDLGNNGKVSFMGAPDPLWSSRTDFPAGELTVSAQNSIHVAITVHMPAHIAPDLYYIGFLVTPVATGSGVIQINQIASFVTINVPGPRVRKMTAVLQAPVGVIHLGALVIGSKVAGTLLVRNTGKSSIQFWGENDSSASIGGATPIQGRIPVSLLPVGASRSLAMTSTPGFPIDVVTMTVSVFYPNTTLSGTKQIVISKTFLVVNPWVILVVCVLIIVALSWWMYSRRRRS